MRESKRIQAELDAAQADLESNIGQLKDLVDAKLEGPKRAVESARHALAFVALHKWWFVAGAAALLLLTNIGEDDA